MSTNCNCNISRKALDEKKDKLIKMIRRGGYTYLSYNRLDNLYRLAQELETKGIEGSFVECGVWNGGSAGVLASIGRNRQIWLFDSWEGLPEPTKEDYRMARPEKGRKGLCKSSEEKAKELIFDKIKSDKEKVHFIKGWFKDTIPQQIDKIGKIALLHLDCDWYESFKFSLDSLYGNIVKNGIIVPGNYPFVTWQGNKKAVDEFLERISGDVKLVEGQERILNIHKQ